MQHACLTIRELGIADPVPMRPPNGRFPVESDESVKLPWPLAVVTMPISSQVSGSFLYSARVHTVGRSSRSCM